MLNNFRPLPGRIIVKQNEATQLSSGFILNEKALDKPASGVIVALGINESTEGLKVGDSVLFGTYSGQKIQLNKQEYLHLTRSDIMGVSTL